MDSSQNLGTKKRSIGKKLIFVFAALFALLVVAYFVGTSGAFFKAVILPKVSASLNAEVRVEDASISPFSSVTLKKLTVRTTGTDPVISAEEVRAKYSLMDIIKGNINVSEVALISPTVNIVKEADGSSNLDPLLKKDASKDDKKDEGAKKDSQINISNVSLQNGTVRQTSKQKDGGAQKVELTGLNVNLDKLGAGQRGKLTINSAFVMDATAAGTNDFVSGKIEGGYDIALNKEMMPEVLQGSTKLNLAEARGAYANYATFNAILEADVTPTEIKNVALRFAKGETNLGQVRVAGPFDLNKKEGILRVELLALDKNLLNFAGAGNGMDFRNSTFNITNMIELTQGGNMVTATGGLLGNRVSVVQNGQATPEVNLDVQYQANVDVNAKKAVLNKLQISGLDGNTPFLLSRLDQPMNISFGGAAVQGAKDASLNLILTNFNLAAWKPVLGTNISSGLVNATLTLTSQQDGKLLKTDLITTIANLAVQNGTNTLQDLLLRLNVIGTVEQMKLVNISDYQINLQQAGEAILNGAGAAKYDLEAKTASAQISSASSLGRLAKIGGMNDLQASTGVLKLNGNFSDDAQKKIIKAVIQIEDWTGKYQEYAFNKYGITIDSDIVMQGTALQINKASMAFAEAGNKGGNLDLTGKYDQKTSAGQFTFKSEGMNETALRPFLAASLGEKKLVSINFAANGSATLDPEKETAIKTDLNISNLVVDDPSGSVPKEPLGVKLNLDGGMKDNFLNIRQLIVGLTPTPRAKNELKLVAGLDLNKAHPKPSTLSLTSDGLDVTTYYNLFSGNPAATNTVKSAPAKPVKQAAAAPVINAVPTEPEPITLPFGNLTGNVKFDRFYLRDVAITNMVAAITMSNQVVALPQIKMNLNGGNVDGLLSANVGVPGYQYNVNLKIDNAPLEPLATSFSSIQPGTMQGLLLANIKINGAGTTDKSLQKNLNGDIAINMTNMNYQVVGPKWRKVLVPISLALRSPELLQTPINYITGDVKIGGGNINVEGLKVASEAFFANVHGVIKMNDVLTNSPLDLPVDLSLRRSIASKIGMLPPNTAEDAKYARLPTFVTLKGTIGDPQSDIHKTAVGLAVLDAAGDKIKEVAPIKNALNALTGRSPVETGTNASAGNKDINKGANLIQGVRGLFGGKTQTNAVPAPNRSTNATPPAASTALKAPEANKPAGTNNPAEGATTATNKPAVDQAIDLFNRFRKK